MTRDPLHLTKKEATRGYNLMKALLKWVEQERGSLHRIAEELGKMPPLQRESDAVGHIEKIVALRQKKLIEALQHLKPEVEKAHRRVLAAGLVKGGATRTGKQLKQQKTGVEFASAACADCDMELRTGSYVATCNHCNIKFHSACISPMFQCGKCNADLSQFQAAY
ncbi:MAG: hypothetical protein QF366_02135 [Candidatus Poseidoniia archaeon]|jgi:hypothetical protein|nr:hypothetical protein [Candidatus Poseidoniia archaeon]MDP6658488.1 hypothetical protein [Candidatus Poseidoniia archaeon]MDP6846428.1 hypothetical protein [Candidatus Poseidoniia archaeon]MDP7007531.1 hypothetical protein [Candidatus Poseidoniia archaeon]|tara:strand:- start:73 stop:570 length:498 start_codon:yes stop_codon:yes gene_type:complete